VVSRHFGPKTFWHHETGAEVSGQIGTSVELPRGHFGTGTELSRPPPNIFATVGCTEERFNIIQILTGAEAEKLCPEVV